MFSSIISTATLADDLADGALQACARRLPAYSRESMAAHHLVARYGRFCARSARAPRSAWAAGAAWRYCSFSSLGIARCTSISSMRSSSGRGDGIHRVGRGDEHHAGKIERRFEIVIAESVSSARCRALRASRSPDRRAHRRPFCRFRQAGRPGFIVPACLMDEMIRPGIAPIYVLRWPRISASSRTPPSDI